MNPNNIYLTQTDTTVGFVSIDHKKLSKIKQRDENQPFLICVNSLEKQKKISRTPKKFKNFIRRAKKTTFIYPNQKAIRVVNSHSHMQFLKKFQFLLSSSANLHKKKFDLNFALKNADIIIEDKTGFKNLSSSKIYKIGKKSYKRIR